MAAYKITLNKNGGIGSNSSVYYDTATGRYYSDSSLSTVVTQVPAISSSKGVFIGYFASAAGPTDEQHQYIRSDGTFGPTVPTEARAVYARWQEGFQTIIDWFGLESANLRPIASDSGDDIKRICVANATVRGSTQSNAGRYTSGVSAAGGIWRNPSVTYEVVGDMTLAVTLGDAFEESSGISGYMITSVKVTTQIGKFPQVTVTGVANEGADAINKFVVSVPIQSNARAQNLLNAVSGGGQLQTCELVASCEPVVIEEDLMPCASDVVHGRISVSASLYAPNAEAAPSASNGFASIGAPKQCGDKNYIMWQLNAQKEIA